MSAVYAGDSYFHMLAYLSSYFHVLKYTSEGMLLSHMIAVRSRQVTRGFLIRARVDYSGALRNWAFIGV